MRLTLLFLLIASVCYGQPTKIKKERIEEAAFKPTTMGVLPGTELTFSGYHRWYTLSVTSDMALTLAASGNVANVEIHIIATGDGTHLLTFPSDWEVGNGSYTYDPNKVNEIRLRYNGSWVSYNIIGQKAIDVLETELESAVVTTEVPTELNLVFNEAMNVTDDGWAVDASAGEVSIGGVAGSGTTTIVFTLSRAILHSETVTVSYAGELEGTTEDLAGFDLEPIVDFPVTVPDPPPPVTQDCDRTVIQGGGGDHTTITSAANAASPDETICIGDGTYRETITPTDNNLTFVALEGTTPIISGFDVVGTSGWTVHSGNIYKKTITLPVNGFNTQSTAFSGNVVPNTTILANQIIRNGTMMHEARYPNVDSYDDLMSWEDGFKQYDDAAGFKYNQLNDVNLPTTPPALVGATLVSNGWYITFARTILAHDNSGPGSTERVTYPNIREAPPANGAYMRQAYYITNDLGLLDAEQEWHYESSTLYFWQPGGGSPSGTIEYKARNWGFDLRGRSGVTIKGLTFTGVDPVIADAASTNTTIQGTTATYNNHHVRHDINHWNGLEVGMARQLGTKLLGANSVFKDNVWSKAATVQLWLGPNVIVENNKLSDAGYAGNQGGAISLWDQDGGQKILRNDIYNHGKGCIFFGYTADGTHSNVEIAYNNFYDFGTVLGDGGASYAGHGTLTPNLNYHHNWIHGNRSRPFDLGGENGTYFDQYSGGGTIHHNVYWDIHNADFYHQIESNGSGPLFNIYNNTFASTNENDGQECSYKSPVTSPLDILRNNIFVRRININWTSSIGNNQNYIYQYGNGTNPLFVGPGEGSSGLDYRIQTGSPAKNAGQVIAGITDGAVGVPDIGAYEFGGEDWVPGYVVPANDGTVNDDEWSYTINWNEDNTGAISMIDDDTHYTTTLTTATATSPEFTNAKAKIYLEGCDQHGVALLEILNASNVVIDSHEFDTYTSEPCGGAPVQLEYEFTGLAAGTKRARVSLFSVNTGTTPPRTSIALDGGRFYD